ncbi:hypothetical protein ANO11243_025350 [Dothideomycetidae sp. 11243]|nr:hypothetical protein ANO11243_025350 [fungal sp. No.11243]
MISAGRQGYICHDPFFDPASCQRQIITFTSTSGLARHDMRLTTRLATGYRIVRDIFRPSSSSSKRWASSSAPARGHNDLTPPSDAAPLPPKKRGRPRKPPSSPLLLPNRSTSHNDLASFESYATATGLSPQSTVYIGTHYEYTVAQSLARLGFTLHRVGGAADLGIDLVGDWRVPGVLRDCRVLVQCKAMTPTPSHVREMEGAMLGAPVGWRGPGAVGMLAARGDATKGVREALQRSRVPMGFVAVRSGGRVVQMLWNALAADAGLTGIGVGTRFCADGAEEVVLTLGGKVVKGS